MCDLQILLLFILLLSIIYLFLSALSNCLNSNSLSQSILGGALLGGAIFGGVQGKLPENDSAPTFISGPYLDNGGESVDPPVDYRDTVHIICDAANIASDWKQSIKEYYDHRSRPINLKDSAIFADIARYLVYKIDNSVIHMTMKNYNICNEAPVHKSATELCEHTFLQKLMKDNNFVHKRNDIINNGRRDRVKALLDELIINFRGQRDYQIFFSNLVKTIDTDYKVYVDEFENTIKNRISNENEIFISKLEYEYNHLKGSARKRIYYHIAEDNTVHYKCKRRDDTSWNTPEVRSRGSASTPEINHHVDSRDDTLALWLASGYGRLLGFGKDGKDDQNAAVSNSMRDCYLISSDFFRNTDTSRMTEVNPFRYRVLHDVFKKFRTIQEQVNYSDIATRNSFTNCASTLRSRDRHIGYNIQYSSIKDFYNYKNIIYTQKQDGANNRLGTSEKAPNKCIYMISDAEINKQSLKYHPNDPKKNKVTKDIQAASKQEATDESSGESSGESRSESSGESRSESSGESRSESYTEWLNNFTKSNCIDAKYINDYNNEDIYNKITADMEIVNKIIVFFCSEPTIDEKYTQTFWPKIKKFKRDFQEQQQQFKKQQQLQIKMPSRATTDNPKKRSRSGQTAEQAAEQAAKQAAENSQNPKRHRGNPPAGPEGKKEE